MQKEDLKRPKSSLRSCCRGFPALRIYEQRFITCAQDYWLHFLCSPSNGEHSFMYVCQSIFLKAFCLDNTCKWAWKQNIIDQVGDPWNEQAAPSRPTTCKVMFAGAQVWSRPINTVRSTVHALQVREWNLETRQSSITQKLQPCLIRFWRVKEMIIGPGLISCQLQKHVHFGVVSTMHPIITRSVQ